MSKNENISKLIKRVLNEAIGGEDIKFGMTDSGGSTKIKELQKAMKLRSTKTGQYIATGHFGELTNAQLMSKVPDLYTGKNDTIDDTKYNQILSKLKTIPEPRVPPRNEQPSGNVVSSINFENLWQNFPKNSYASTIFPIIFPTEYQKYPNEFANLCATRLSLALNNLGVKPTAQLRTQNDLNWNGVVYKKNIPITLRAKDTPQYLKNRFGNPTYTFENTTENTDKFLKAKKGIFVITGVPGWTATGHADIFYSTKGGFSCGHHCYFGDGGKIQVWVVK